MNQNPEHTPESTGKAFELSSYLNAREKAWHLLYQIQNFIEENYQDLSEEDIHVKIKEVFGPEVKFWHPHKVRFAENTRCSFRDQSKEDVSLFEGDKYFIDIGPILNQHEADVGQTYCIGNKTFQNPAQVLYNQLEEIWKKDALTGEALYEKASELAHEMGCELNEKMQGHRLGDFPHALFHRGGLNEFEAIPQEMLWVLEIHLLDLESNEGYFFEDILGAPVLDILR